MAKKKPFPPDAVQFIHQPLEGWERQAIGTDAAGKIIYEALSLDGTQSIVSGDWCVEGKWLSAEEFASLYELPPEPEPVPEPPAPEPVAEVAPPLAPLPPEPEPPVTPTIHRIVPIEDPPPPLSIGPSALNVDQGRMS